MAVIKIAAREGDAGPKPCRDRSPAVLSGNYYEFRDASEEELAFWNILNDNEKQRLTDQAYNNCFFEALHEFMNQEARKGEKMKRQEEAAGLSGQQPGPQTPPNTPPAPSPSGGPPIQS